MSPPPHAAPPGSRAHRHAATRRALVEQATLAFASRGYDRATLGDIAAAAGVSKGGVHHHFRVKSDLLAPVIDRCLATLEARAIGASAEVAAPMNRLRAGLRAVLGAARSRDPSAMALVGLIARAPHDAIVRAAIAPRLSAVEARIAEALARGTEAAGVPLGANPAHIASALVAWVTGLALRHGLDEGSAPEERTAPLAAVLAMIG